MCRHQHAACLGYGGKGFGGVIGKLDQFCHMPIGIGAKWGFMLGCGGNQRVANGDNHLRPEGRVHPHMGVEFVLVDVMGDELVMRQAFGHGNDFGAFLF